MRTYSPLPIRPPTSTLTPTAVVSTQPRVTSTIGGTAHLKSPLRTELYGSHGGETTQTVLRGATIRSSVHRPTSFVSPSYDVHPTIHANQAILAPTVLLRPEIFTTPRMSVVSDKQIPVVGTYMSN